LHGVQVEPCTLVSVVFPIVEKIRRNVAMIFGARKLNGVITEWHRKSDMVFVVRQ